MNNFDEHGLYTIYPVWHLPFWKTDWFFWAALALIMLMIFLILYVAYRWYRKKSVHQTTFWERSLELIRALQQQKYETKEQGKQCYFILTGELKKYLEHRYQYPLSKKTDEEISAYLKTEDVIPVEIKNDLHEIMKGCLFIKYANAHAMEEQIRKHLIQATMIINRTAPIKITQPRSSR